MKLEDFPHIVLLKDQNTKFKEFDDELKDNLSSFDRSFKTFLIKKDENILKELNSRSKVLAQHIMNYYVIEEEPQPPVDPVPEPEPPVLPVPEPPAPPQKKLSKNEDALRRMYEENIVDKITFPLLARYGFDTGINTPVGRRGCIVGDYQLIRYDENYYKLVKK